MCNDNTEQGKRRSKWTTSYSNMTIREAEERLGLTIESLRGHAISVEDMLAQFEYKVQDSHAIKERVYGRILEHLETEGYPGEEDLDFKEANISDLVPSIVSPILTNLRCKTGRTIRLWREEEIVSADCETGGTQEFVVMDMIAKRSSLGEAIMVEVRFTASLQREKLGECSDTMVYLLR